MAAFERLAPLLTTERSETAAGYLDVLGPERPRASGISQNLMMSRALPMVYERWWRPTMGRMVKGFRGPGMADEHRIALELLELGPGMRVLDVACGPGNFTRAFARVASEQGLVVGFDASARMLARAVRDTQADTVAYVRGDAVALPFRASSFDAVCCFAALNLFDEPWKALDDMTRVLAPGGRIALFTSARHDDPLRGNWDRAMGVLAGVTVFGRDELTDGLAARGFEQVTQRIAGVTQFVGGRRSRARRPRPAARAQPPRGGRRPPRSAPA